MLKVNLREHGRRPDAGLPRAAVRLDWRWLLVLAALAGCASPQWVALRQRPKNPLSEQLNLFARGGPKPTERTIQLLRRYDLLDHLEGDNRPLIAKLQQITIREPRAENVYALSELAYIGARKIDHDDQRALDLYGTSVVYAYVYLFDPRFDASRNPYDPQYRGASELYNTALESSLRILQKRGGLRPDHSHTVKTASAQVRITVAVHGSTWQSQDLDKFQFVSDYKLEGLKNHYQGFGLGVPLVAVRKKREQSSPTERYYPPNLSFPVTAFLRLHDCDPLRENQPAKFNAVLELHDPLDSPDIQVADRIVPLESDVSTPLAYFLNQPEFQDSKLSTAGLLTPEEAQSLQGLYMLEPYQPGKIPVVMVHGLWSSPVTWMEMFNDLRSAPEIRRNYQFWFYLYPTGKPFWFSATQMREDLAAARMILDPQHQQAALDQMVLVGHSMGGLVSKLQTLESNDDFWHILTKRPLEQVRADPEVRNTLAKTFFFEPNPSIRRVVTIGTPHRGSDFANDVTRWFGRKLITLPKQFVATRQKLIQDNPGLFNETPLLAIDTSIDSLAPDSPILPVMLAASTAPWVTYHNIIGQVPADSLLNRFSGTSDGVVQVASAHLPDAASEITIPADHSNVHRHPRAVLEVRRILLEHLRELRGSSGVYPAIPIHYQRSPN